MVSITKTGDTVWRRFTAALTRTMTSGTTADRDAIQKSGRQADSFRYVAGRAGAGAGEAEGRCEAALLMEQNWSEHILV